MRKLISTSTKKSDLQRISEDRFIKDGGYLLSHLVGSTIGVVGLNFSVRDGKRWNPGAIAT